MGRFFVLGNLIAQLFEALKAEGLGLKEILDDMLDVVEQRIADSPTKLDDRLIQPLIDSLRAYANVPDNIGGDPD